MGTPNLRPVADSQDILRGHEESVLSRAHALSDDLAVILSYRQQDRARIAQLERDKAELQERLEAAESQIDRRQRLSVEEAAAFLKVSTHTLKGWRMRKIGPPWEYDGRHPVYVLADLERYRAGRRVETKNKK